VGPGAVLEEGVRLRSHVSVTGITRIGAGCDLYPGVVLEATARSGGNDFTEGRLEIGAACVLREMVSMKCGQPQGRWADQGGARGYSWPIPCRS